MNARTLRVLALVDITEAVERFQQGEDNVDKALETIAAVLGRLAADQRYRSAA